ncbi:MAG: hypothetical protein LBB09_00175 [Rickettsiales bacterium]|jgi:hypothetical protein|nr:hypothetical protein [Rickettsiales bacterium]
MGNDDQILADFMMSQTPEGGKEKGDAGGGQDKKGKGKKDGKDAGEEELSEEEKELQEAKKKAAATLKNIPFNPEMAKRQFKKLFFFYSIAGLLALGLMLYSKKNKGWVSKGIHGGLNLIMFGKTNAR